MICVDGFLFLCMLGVWDCAFDCFAWDYIGDG